MIKAVSIFLLSITLFGCDQQSPVGRFVPFGYNNAALLDTSTGTIYHFEGDGPARKWVLATPGLSQR
ncbi:lipoprotein, putative [Citrifermentans bemidjiense Bem]|uniref:Lipoprotein, putative n=1 Tax=Citrifermentans bemidjiense (strain ATCC BAA-1014 / DSM 16622 / JCM 12645 / Bem) TaxID=404380 RepID=E1P699_CITBB|nr:hypothetical protein [Citrifermentans bemidjiense]ADO00794.1 lipoprotein, putative [Citrifermentans bemidjiense Bem]